MMNFWRIAILSVLFVQIEIALSRYIDRPVSEHLRLVDAQNPALINLFRAYTDLGKSVWYLWPSGIGILLCAVYVRLIYMNPEFRRKAAHLGEALLFVFLGIGIAGIVTDILKPLFGRARPVELLRDGVYGFHPLTFGAAWNSMPSGHATTAFALACVLAALFPRWRIVWYVLAVVLAASRVMVNAHYLSDILAGAVVGIATVSAVGSLLNHRRIFPLVRCIFPIDEPLPPR